MKTLLSLGGASLLTGALLDPLIQSGLGGPIPWVRDLLMGGAGMICIHLLVKHRKDL